MSRRDDIPDTISSLVFRDSTYLLSAASGSRSVGDGRRGGGLPGGGGRVRPQSPRLCVRVGGVGSALYATENRLTVYLRATYGTDCTDFSILRC